MKRASLLILLVVSILTFGLTQLYTEKPETGFWVMEGTLVTHPFVDNIDSLSGQEIYELQDEKGITVWFARDIFKDVCMTGQCKMIGLWLFWDGVGNYLGIQLHDNEPLTKSDHTPFESHDYLKLNDILSNPYSILRNVKTEDLTIEDEPDKNIEVDGITSATDPTLEHIIVKGAIYTCHTLWHTVYGHTRDTIQLFINQRVTHEYLKLLFENDNPAYSKWAIDYISNNSDYHQEFYEIIANLIKSDNHLEAKQALDYFYPTQLAGKNEQRLLLSILHEVNQQKKFDIIWKFAELEEIDFEIVVKLLELFKDQEIGVGGLNPVYRLIRSEHFEDQRVVSILDELSTNDDGYIRFQTEKMIREINSQ